MYSLFNLEKDTQILTCLKSGKKRQKRRRVFSEKNSKNTEIAINRKVNRELGQQSY
jgi:hypothetical protein